MPDFPDELRYLLSLLLFCLGIYLIADLFLSGFSIAVLIGIAITFYLAHKVKPASRKEENIESDMYDLIDLITDFPYRLVATALRNLGRILGRLKDNDGIDIDD